MLQDLHYEKLPAGNKKRLMHLQSQK